MHNGVTRRGVLQLFAALTVAVPALTRGAAGAAHHGRANPRLGLMIASDGRSARRRPEEDQHRDGAERAPPAVQCAPALANLGPIPGLPWMS